MIGISALALLLAVGTCGATEFCGSGPDTKLDHPCEDDFDSAMAAAARYQSQWASISGVAAVTVAQYEGDRLQLVVYVDPASLVPSIRATLPTEADGFPVQVVRLVSGSQGVIISPGHIAYAEMSLCHADDSSDPQSDADSSDTNTSQFEEAIRDHETQSWIDLPGVLRLGPLKCGNCDCNPPQIAVTVQSAMMESVQEQIPATQFGVPVVVVPSDGAVGAASDGAW